MNKKARWSKKANDIEDSSIKHSSHEDRIKMISQLHEVKKLADGVEKGGPFGINTLDSHFIPMNNGTYYNTLNQEFQFFDTTHINSTTTPSSIENKEEQLNDTDMKIKTQSIGKVASSSGSYYDRLKKEKFLDPNSIIHKYKRAPVRKVLLDEDGELKVDSSTKSDDEKFLSHDFTFKELELKIENKVISYEAIQDYLVVADTNYNSGKINQAKKYKYYTLALKGKFLWEEVKWNLENVYDFKDQDVWDFFQSIHYTPVDYNDQSNYNRFSACKRRSSFDEEVSSLKNTVKNDGNGLLKKDLININDPITRKKIAFDAPGRIGGNFYNPPTTVWNIADPDLAPAHDELEPAIDEEEDDNDE